MASALIFGDVHGNVSALRKLVKRARNLGGKDTKLYSVGNLVNIGRESRDVVQFCVDNDVEAVIGNGDLWLYRLLSEGILEGYPFDPRNQMGAIFTVISYIGMQAGDDATTERAIEKMLQMIPQDHKEFILGLALYREIDFDGTRYRITHAGVKTQDAEALMTGINKSGGEELTERDRCDIIPRVLAEEFGEQITWVTTKSGNVYKFPDGSFQVFGHEPWDNGRTHLGPFFAAVDSGAEQPGGILSGLLLREGEERKIITHSGGAAWANRKVVAPPRPEPRKTPRETPSPHPLDPSLSMLVPPGLEGAQVHPEGVPLPMGGKMISFGKKK